MPPIAVSARDAARWKRQGRVVGWYGSATAGGHIAAGGAATLIRAHPSLTEFVGEVDEVGKDALLGGAYAFLFPIDWPEPFDLAMAEVTFRAGSVPEVVVDGVTGFAADTLHDMAEAIPRVREPDRRARRTHVERHFSPAR